MTWGFAEEIVGCSETGLRKVDEEKGERGVEGRGCED